MIDFSKVTSVTIPEGSVIKISDSDGVVYWQKKLTYMLLTLNLTM